jgi:hypothetical protein
MKKILCPLLLSASLLLTGCKLFGPAPAPPTPFEQHLFTIQTNYNPQVVVSPSGQVTTNLNPSYQWGAPSPAAQAGTGIISTVANMAFPGSGALASLAAAGVLALWGRLRSTNSTNAKINGSLVQGIETAKQVLNTTPQGTDLSAALTAWLVKHQSAAGVISQVSQIVDETVDSSAAKDAAALIVSKLPPTTPKP